MAGSGKDTFGRLMFWQVGSWGVAGLLGGWAFRQYGLGGEAILPLVGCAILGLIGQFGTMIANELMEVNDQLAGRSPELRDWARGQEEMR